MQQRRTTVLASALIIALVASLGFLRTTTAQPITIPNPGVASYFTVLLGANDHPLDRLG